MIATVEDGKLIALRPDKDHPVSQGFACPKGIAFADLHNDPDRVTTPLRNRGDGTFEPVSWDEAMTDIAARLADIHRRHGSGALGWYFGNPGAFSYSHQLWLNVLLLGMGLEIAPVHRRLAGRQQPVRRQPVALRLTAGAAGARRPAHRLPRRHRRQPDRVARQRPHRPADPRPDARHRQARRARAGDRPAQDRDRRAVRVAGHRPGRRRLPAAVAAAGDAVREAGRPRGYRCPRPTDSTGWSGWPRRSPPRPPSSTPASRRTPCADWPAISSPLRVPPSTAGWAPASGATAR